MSIAPEVRRRPTQALLRPVTWLLMAMVRFYRLFPHPGPPRCRFYPSCSSYALQALDLHGPFRGLWLAGRRLLRCHPYNPGGVDHVPVPDASGAGGS